MKKRTVITRLLLTILAATLMVGIALPAPAARAATADINALTEIPYTYRDTATGKHLSSTFVYRDEMFLTNAKTLSPDLAKISVALASAAYTETFITQVLQDKMGFTVLGGSSASYAKMNELSIDDNDHVAYTIASKPIQNGEYIVYCVSVKGTGGNAEWYSNFNLGSGKAHQGFTLAANEVYQDLLSCMKNEDPAAGKRVYAPENTIVLVTGHSRGAAVANIIAGWLTSNGLYAEPEHIFGYTFACPAVGTEADPLMQNIFNFNHPGDLIALLPLESWGYKRNGIDFDILQGREAENLSQQFARISEETFAAAAAPDGYLLALNALLFSVEVYHKPAIQAVLYKIAYGLGGNKDTTEEELNAKCQEILSVIGIDTLANFDLLEWAEGQAVDAITERNELLAFLVEHLINVSSMSEEEFNAFLTEHQDTIMQIEKICNTVVSSPDAFAACKTLMEDAVQKLVDLQDIIMNLYTLFFETADSPKDPVFHAHTQLTYISWINTLFYGHEGWYGYTPISGSKMAVTLSDAHSSIGRACFKSSAGIGSLIISDSVQFLGDEICSNAAGLERLRLPNGITKIGASAFSGCTSLTGELIIPETVTSIGELAFHNCYNLKELQLPACIPFSTYTGRAAFSSCRGLEKITLTGSGDMASYGETHAPWYSRNNLNGKFTVVIEDGVTSISSRAFFQMDGLTSVTIPESVTSIGEGAFSGCTNLAKADLPAKLRSLGDSAFNDCSALASLTIPSTLTTIPKNAFSGCTGLVGELVIPETVTSIGNAAFSGCTKLTELRIPVKLPFTTYQNSYAFSSCLGLKQITLTGSGPMATHEKKHTPWNDLNTLGGDYSIVIEEGITSISNSAFQDCSKLISVTIPDTVTSIGEQAFRSCSRLTEVTLPVALKSVGDSAFYNCNSLADVYYDGSETQWTAISIARLNDPLLKARRHYNCAELVMGKMEAEETLHWSYNTTSGEIGVSGTIPENDRIYAAAYSKGRLIFIGFLSEDQLLTVSADADCVKLFWVDGSSIPQCEAATIEGI